MVLTGFSLGGWVAFKIPSFLIVYNVSIFCNSIPCFGKGKKKGRRGGRVEGGFAEPSPTPVCIPARVGTSHSPLRPSHELQDFRGSLLASRAAGRICGVPGAGHMAPALIISAKTPISQMIRLRPKGMEPRRAGSRLKLPLPGPGTPASSAQLSCWRKSGGFSLHALPAGYL